jgi:hypothetical protein
VAEFYDRWINRWLTEPPQEEMRVEFEQLLRDHLGETNPDRRWGWKEPRSIYLLAFLDAQLPSLRFLHLVRDGRDMAFSANQNQLRKHADAALGEGEPSPQRSIELWAWANAMATRHGERMGERYLRIRYEDLCREPDSVIRQMLLFFDLDCDPRACRELVNPSKSLGRWRSQDPSVIAELEQIAGPTLTEFGYL